MADDDPADADATDLERADADAPDGDAADADATNADPADAGPPDEGAPPAGALLGRGLFEEGMAPGSSLAHLYRAEVHRMTRWRERLDRTTNWAVLLMAAILTWAFSSESNPHYIVLVGIAAVCVFLLIEARRYRGYDIWRSRVRLLQENVLADALDETLAPPDPDWRAKLSRDYLGPTMKLSTEQAVAHRLRRVYLALLGVLVGAWLVRVTAFADAPWPSSADVGSIPGTLVTAAVAAFLLALLAIAFRPRDWKGELLEEAADEWERHGEG